MPFGSTTLADPMPPLKPPDDAPVAAPTQPCSTGPSDAAAYATLPSSGSGWWWNVTPAAEVEQHRAGDDRDDLPGPADRPAVTVGEQALDDAVGGGEARSADRRRA